MNRKSILVRIEGRVQGVGFRYWTQLKATELELSGWVRNRRNGTVEAQFSGSPEAIENMLKYCYEGPRFLSVENISYVITDHPEESGFTQKTTL